MDPLAPKVWVDAFGATDIGRVRKQNEDNFLMVNLQSPQERVGKQQLHWQVGARGLLFGICDGMGGAAAGEVASQMAVDIVVDACADMEPGVPPQTFAKKLDLAIQQANQAIHYYSCQESYRKGMGTTISVVGLYANLAF
ncbi:MAG: hypothetical protein AAGJ35_01385, partial [Myxococcota bacterium]